MVQFEIYTKHGARNMKTLKGYKIIYNPGGAIIVFVTKKGKYIYELFLLIFSWTTKLIFIIMRGNMKPTRKKSRTIIPCFLKIKDSFSLICVILSLVKRSNVRLENCNDNCFLFPCSFLFCSSNVRYSFC